MQLLYKLIVGSILALIGIGALIGGVSSFYPSALGKTSCKIHRNFIRVIPLPPGTRPDLPDFCLDTVKGKRERVEQLTNRVLGDKIYECWKRVDRGDYGQDVRCYELYIESTAEGIGEEGVTDFLREQDLCQQLANNQTAAGDGLNCGNRDQIKWEIASISAEQTVIIKYNALAGWIEII